MCNNLRSKVEFLASLTRCQEWKDTKLNWYVFAAIMYFLSRGVSPLQQNIAFTYLIVLFFIYASAGAISNDYGDLEQDRLLKKKKAILSLKESKVVLLLLILSVVFEIVVLNLTQAFDFRFILITVGYGICLEYSLPPLRFKERGVWGLLFGSMVQRAIPVAILFTIFSFWTLSGVLYVIFLIMVGFRAMIVHQMKDYENDIKSRTKTMATNSGVERMVKLENASWIVELLTFFVFLISLTLQMEKLFLLFGFVTYLLTWGGIKLWKYSIIQKLNKFSMSNAFLADWYYWWLPAIAAVALGTYTGNWLVLFFVAIMQRFHFFNLIKKFV